MNICDQRYADMRTRGGVSEYASVTMFLLYSRFLMNLIQTSRPRFWMYTL